LGGEPGPERPVRRDAPREDHALDPRAERGPHGLAHEHLDDCGLERRGDVGDLPLAERRVALHVERHRCLDAAEREVGGAVGHLRERERDRLLVARRRRALDDGPAGESESEQLGDLVEGLPRGVVARPADERVGEGGSGTTPPYGASTASCEATTFDKIRKSSATTAAAVSSHEVSIPSTRIASLRLEPASRTPLQKPRAMRPSPPPPARIALETVPNATAAGPDPEGSGA